MAKLPFGFTELVSHVVQSAPSPEQFTGDASTTTLGTLGIDPKTVAKFRKRVAERVAPWQIRPTEILASGKTTIADCALSLHAALKPPLDPDKLIDYVVQSTPFPDKYTGDPVKSTLGSLGVNPKTAGGVVAGIQAKITPWKVNSSDVVTAGNKTVQDCALSVNDHAF